MSTDHAVLPSLASIGAASSLVGGASSPDGALAGGASFLEGWPGASAIAVAGASVSPASALPAPSSPAGVFFVSAAIARYLVRRTNGSAVAGIDLPPPD